MSDTIQRLCFGVLLSLGFTATANSASAQQAEPAPQPSQTSQQPTARPSPRTRPPPLPEPGLPLPDPVQMAPIRVPRVRTREQDLAANSLMFPPDVRSPTDRRRIAEHETQNSIVRVTVSGAVTIAVTVATEALILFGFNQWHASFFGAQGGPALLVLGFSSAVFLIPAAYSLTSYPFGGTGSYAYSVLGNLVGALTAATVTLAASGDRTWGELVAFGVSPVALVVGSVLGYELSRASPPTSVSSTRSRSARILPSIFANETTRGLTLSGSF